MANIHRICQSVGIRLMTRRKMHPRQLPPRHTWACRTIKLLAIQGEKANYPTMAHDVLSLFLASEANSCQLYGDTISGVGIWYQANKYEPADTGFLIPAFRALDLGLIRHEVVRFGLPGKAHQIALLVASESDEDSEALRVYR